MIEYFSYNIWLLWTIVALVCLIIELGSGDFFVTCFAIGAGCGVVASLCGTPFWLQVVVFAACSVLSILFIRPKIINRLHATGHERQSNADALIGRVGTVIEAIPEGSSGYVKVDGDEWKAVTDDGSALKKGAKARIKSMKSIIVTVEEVQPD